MKILVIGSGGREHAIIRKLKESPQVDALYCAPGNGGISRDAECSPVNVMDKEGMLALAREKQVDLVFVAPDDPLAAGMVDFLEAAGFPCFGPNAKAAEIESSKVFSKNLMKKYGITYRYAGENIAMGQRTPEEVVKAWMNSEGHRKNILSPNYNYIGVGYVAQGNYWTQEFIGK